MKQVYSLLVLIFVYSFAQADEPSLPEEVRSLVSVIKEESGEANVYRSRQQIGMLTRLLSNMSGDACRMRSFLGEIAQDQDPRSREIIRHAAGLVDEKWSTQLRLLELGLPINRTNSRAQPLTPQQSNTMFGGSGISGVFPGDRERIPLGDMARMVAGDVETRGRYDDVMPPRPEFLTGQPNPSQEQYITSFLNQNIVTKDTDAYCGQVPSRSSIIRLAACQHNINPHILAGFLLAEQQDQTINEDRVDYQGGRGILGIGRNTSVGIAQIQVENGMANHGEIFSDLIPDYLPRGRRQNVVDYLASDEYAIFAAARFIRNLANQGADRWNSPGLSQTRQQFPNITPADLRGGRWNESVVRLLGSEYTSRPWDDKLHLSWGGVVTNMGLNSSRVPSDLRNSAIRCDSNSQNLNGVYRTAYPEAGGSTTPVAQ